MKIVRKEVNKSELSLDGYKYGVNPRPITELYVGDIKLNRYVDSLDIVPIVVLHGGIKKFVIVDGQHLVVSKDDKNIWLVDIIDGDLNKDEDKRLRNYCLSLAMKKFNSTHQLAYGDRVLLMIKLREEFVRENGTEYGCYGYVSSITGDSEGIIKQIVRIENMVKDSGMKLSDVRNLSQTAIIKRCELIKKTLSNDRLIPLLVKEKFFNEMQEIYNRKVNGDE